jgi:hypothetical protein
MKYFGTPHTYFYTETNAVKIPHHTKGRIEQLAFQLVDEGEFVRDSTYVHRFSSPFSEAPQTAKGQCH